MCSRCTRARGGTLTRTRTCGGGGTTARRYLCGSAYNPLPQWVWDNMMATSLLHRAVLVLAAILLHMVADFLRGSDHADPAIV